MEKRFKNQSLISFYWPFGLEQSVYVTLNKLLNLLKLHPSLCLGQKPEGHLQVLSFSHTPIYLATVLNVVSNLTPSLPLLPPKLPWIRPVFSFLSSQTNLLEIRIRPSHSRLTVAYQAGFFRLGYLFRVSISFPIPNCFHYFNPIICFDIQRVYKNFLLLVIVSWFSCTAYICYHAMKKMTIRSPF